MKKKRLAISIVSLTCAAAMMIPIIAPITAFATESNAQTIPIVEGSQLPEVPSYDSVYRLSNDHIKSIKNNAGNYGQSVIAKAIDGNKNTHWETNKPNSSTFHNMVTVTFDDLYELANMRYQVRQDAGGKGFPTQYKLYYSTTEDGDDFQLLKEGSLGTVTFDEVKIEFNATQLRRIQFEFVNANAAWASMAEISFYKEDSLTKRIDDLFTDGTCSVLKDTYKDQTMLDEFKSEAMSHPSRDLFLTLLGQAQMLLETPGAFDHRIVTASQRGNVAKEKNRTKINYGMFAFDSTGYYVSPGETIQVYVDADAKGVMPKLVFGQIANDKGGWHRQINLKPGLNTITAQTMDKMNPAAIYISNEALPADQSYAPRVRISGGIKFPLYVQGKTDTQTFQAELEEYLKNVSYQDSDFSNGNPNGYFYNIAEITSDNTTITTSAAGALNEVKTIVKQGSSVEEKMDVWEDMYFEFARYSGYNMEDESSDNYRPRGRFMNRVFSSCPYGFADYGYTGYLGGGSLKRDNGFYASLISAAASGGWAVYHEWGHVYDNSWIGRGESTNNLYSLILQDIYLPNNRMVLENRWEDHFTNYHNTKKYPNDDLFYGAITYQLQAVYGKELYGKAQYVARTNPNGVLNGLTSNNDRLAVSLSIAAGLDLTPHFDYYGEKVGAKAKVVVANLPKDGLKTYYVNDKSFAQDASAFTTENPKPKVQAVSNNGVALTMSIDEPDNAILCYEIYRDGRFIGITNSSTFTDKTYEVNKKYTYTAIAYDRKLNPSLASDEVVENPSKPLIQANEQNLLTMHSVFDPMSYVKAVDMQGNDVSSSIQVLENNVNTSVKGVYTVTYQATDSFGNQSTLSVNFTVKSAYIYLSDLNPKSTKMGWGSLQKDKSPVGSRISLLNNSQAQLYAKGLGAHANSEIVYDVSNQGYDTFEAFIGIDQSHKGHTNSSAKFEVWVDGVKAYNSRMMKSDTNQKYVNVNIAGAKEIKLITNDCGNNNWGDQTVWADAKFVKLSSNPVIDVADYAYESGDTFTIDEILSKATASDVEDGDLTTQIEYTTNYVPGQAGSFEIAYTVTDSDGNCTEKTTMLVVTNGIVYASDTNWKSASSGWKSVMKDKSVTNTPICLFTNSGDHTYQKGIGTHAPSEIVYDLTGKEYYFFTSFVGVDRSGGNSNSTVAFKIYVDGKLVKETSVMRVSSPQEFIKVNLIGAKQLKLVVTDGGNGNAADHANWADAKFLTATKQADKYELYQEIQRANAIVNKGYTAQSWEAFTTTRSNAISVLDHADATQAQVDDALNALSVAIDNLQILIKQALIEVLSYADSMIDQSYVNPMLSHIQVRWSNFVIIRETARALINREDATQKEIDKGVSGLLYSILETGQKYDANTNPVQFVRSDKSLLQITIDIADAIDGSAYTEQSWNELNTAKDQAVAVRDNVLATQAQVDLVAQKLQVVIDGLKLLVDQTELRTLLVFADGMVDQSYVNSKLGHAQTRWSNFVYIRKQAHTMINQAGVTQSQIDKTIFSLLYNITETGQKYIAGMSPSPF